MCHGHPHYHPCSHTSVKWLYCPEAVFDLETGYEAPCGNPIYSTPQPASTDCPLKNCSFKSLRGSWMCCACGQGPNTQGWCTQPSFGYAYCPRVQDMQERATTCDHGCCPDCIRSVGSEGTTPEMPMTEFRRAKPGRKPKAKSNLSHQHGHSLAVENGDHERMLASQAFLSPRSKSSHHETTSAKRTKTHSSGKKKSHKSRS